MARQLIKKGFTKVYALKGGWHEWVGAHYPAEAKKAVIHSLFIPDLLAEISAAEGFPSGQGIVDGQVNEG